jgi:alpha-N-arabinofuranosidase
MQLGRLSFLYGLLVLGVAAADSGGVMPVLHIDAGHPGVKTAAHFYGLMTEEINYSFEGGLYAELIRNRSLKDDPKTPVHWSVVATGGGQGALSLDDHQPLNSEFTASLKLDVASLTAGQRVGVANEGFWGMPVKGGQRYHVSFYAKAAPGFNGPLELSLEMADGSRVFASAEVKRVTDYWKKYEAVLTPETGTDLATNRFVISATGPGTLWFQMVSLFPPTYHGRKNGNRVDIMQKLADLQPTFLRFPGGNYLEGDYFNERFDWKKTIGEIEHRPGHRSPWKYWSTDGMGLLEYLGWCEDLKMEPVLAVFAGYALRHDYAAPGAALQPYVDEALEEIEYVTGGSETKWGAQRAKDGHAGAFALKYVEIGNEDWFDKSGSYDGRFAQFYDAIKAKYPGLQIIATTGVKSRTPDVIDEHFYKKAAQFYAMTTRYDHYDRQGPKIFVGEWATREGAPTPNLNAALGDFAWMTGLERNSDLVIMNCYAPLFVNVNPGAMQWKTDLIGYDAVSSYGSPAYYAQAMFNHYRGQNVLPARIEAGDRPLGFFYSVTGTGGLLGKIYLKAVNTTSSPISLQIEIEGKKVADTGTEVVITSANPTDTNSITEPTKIVPVLRPLGGTGARFNHTFPPYSDTAIQLGAR